MTIIVEFLLVVNSFYDHNPPTTCTDAIMPNSPKTSKDSTGRIRVTDFYADHVQIYDKLTTISPVNRWRKTAVRELSAESADIVVEMGCGTGANLPFIVDQYSSIDRVVGVDVTQNLLYEAHDRTSGFSKISVIRGDAIQPPLQTADAILGTFVLGILDRPTVAIDRWCTLCESGQRIVVMDVVPSHPVGRILAPIHRAFNIASNQEAAFRDVLKTMIPILNEETKQKLAHHPARDSEGNSIYEERVQAGRDALLDRTTCHHRLSLGGGICTILSGKVK